MTHPLDPLTADEIRTAVGVLRDAGRAGPGWRVGSVEVVEPAKAVVRAYVAGDPVARSAEVIGWDRSTGLTSKGVVDLDARAVVSWTDVPGAQAPATLDEFHEAEAAVFGDDRVVAALAARGVTDLSLVLVDTWTFGHALIPEEFGDRRVGWSDLWVRDSEHGNPYAHLVSGLKVIIDLDAMTVLAVEDTPGAPAAPTMGEYVPSLVPGLEVRDDLKPVEITQPSGISFDLDGWGLTWQNWSLRIGFNHREGLVLHTVAFDDTITGRRRPVAHRLSLAEMVVPYRDPSVDHARRTAFDIGEWGLGFMTTSLELGCDCLGEIRYLDATLHDTTGEPYTIRNAICLHEEDDGVLWKHVDSRAGAEVRRRRRMVISCHVTVANYEYLVYWRLYQDGTIECEIRATGIMVTTPFGDDGPPPYGTVVDTRTYAPIHQHFVVARLDLEIDGETNTVVESHTEALPIGPDNPHGLALTQVATPLRTEQQAIQDQDWSSQRSWKITNPSSPNRHGDPVAYKLVPSASIPPLLDPSSPVFRRAQAIGHQLWVTPFAPEERWPCGEFVNQSADDLGLPVWTAADRPIEAADVVLWHVFGIHHVPRPEDWPVMPVDVVSFRLVPFGFFDRNPALDAAPTMGSHCH
ncbi:primary-amine oxidase [Jatrophihabitans sp. YIM 134969]